MAQVSQLAGVKELIIILLTWKFSAGIADNVTILKIQELGMPKEHAATLSLLLTPVQIVIPMVVAKYTGGAWSHACHVVWRNHHGCFLTAAFTTSSVALDCCAPSHDFLDCILPGPYPLELAVKSYLPRTLLAAFGMFIDWNVGAKWLLHMVVLEKAVMCTLSHSLWSKNLLCFGRGNWTGGTLSAARWIDVWNSFIIVYTVVNDLVPSIPKSKSDQKIRLSGLGIEMYMTRQTYLTHDDLHYQSISATNALVLCAQRWWCLLVVMQSHWCSCVVCTAGLALVYYAPAALFAALHTGDATLWDLVPYYTVLFLVTTAYSVFAANMFVSQMAFFAKVSDPAIGGT